MLARTAAQKNGNDFQIIFAHHIFWSSNTGLLSAPKISSPQVSVTVYSNVSLNCLVAVRPSDCDDNSLRWYFNKNSGKLESGEKYDVQERKTNTKCKKDFILTIVNVSEADEGKYKCQYFCDESKDPSATTSTIQLKVFPPSEAGTDTPVISKGLVSRNLSQFKKWKRHQNEWNIKTTAQHPPPRGRGEPSWVNFLGVCAAGLSEPLPHYSLFCGQLKTAF